MVRSIAFNIVKKILCLLLTVLVLFIVSAATFTRQESSAPSPGERFFLQEQWVDSLYQAMSPDERLGQLVWLRAHTDKDEAHVQSVERLIEKYHAGGVCIFNPTAEGTPEKQIAITNRFQALANRVPLFVSIDGEWGVGMRLRGTALSFPRALMLGAVRDDKLIYRMGVAIARHCKRLGVNVNFAPDADVNNNAQNPVIGFRSFGEDPLKVAAKAWMYAKGLEDSGVLASAKHFPGHGDTDTDSHYDLPLIRHSRQRLDSVELFPFKILAEQGIGSVMVAHLQVPALDSTPTLPTSLSYPVITGILKKEMHYKGLILTDGLEMKGVTKYHGKGEVEAKAIAAGVDVLLLPADVDAAFSTIKRWIAEGKIPRERIEESVKKTLRTRYRLGLTALVTTPLAVENVRNEVNDLAAQALKRSLIQNALTLVRNDDKLLPFTDLQNLKIASLAIGATSGNVFQKTLRQYANVECFATDKEISASESERLIKKLTGNTTAVIVSLHGMSQFPGKGFGLTESAKDFVTALSKQTKVILVAFGNPYSLKYFDGVNNVLCAYEDEDMEQDLAAQGLFGVFSFQGTLPVTASERSKGGMGITTVSLQRLGFGLPEEVGMSSEKLNRIDALAAEAIADGATPGCVVLVAKDGKVVFHKAYGKHTYSKDARETTTDDLWDLASITKIAASTISLMKLQEEGKFSVQDPLEKYLPEFAGSNKAKIPLLDMLTHTARLTPWIKFYEKTVHFSGRPLPRYYDNRQSGEFSLPVAKNLWLRADYPDSIWQEIKDSPLLNTREYKYSDLGFYFAGEIVHRLSQQPIEDYVQAHFYQPLGLRTMTYRPLEKFPVERIPPTEDDDYFRARKVQGYVHDMGAAMLNQATGHAGLFSDATDLAVLMQMLLNKGTYGGQQYLRPETINFYTTRCGNCTRRGIGFDMPQRNRSFEHNLSGSASDATFGHLGFTGTAVWADPEEGLIYIFLSNRTYPSMKNGKLAKLNTRVRVQDAIYEALK